ncbi:hypothetical protein TNCV_4195281 [Trichonephila clavipes]|nr:hypothetical protein TNCV_4195281 [Trichonephila clavipes]
MAGFVTSSSSVLLKTRRVGQRCTLNLPKVETPSHWCGVPDGHGYELVSSVRALVPQKFSVEEELMHVKHVEVKSPHVGVMWKFGRGVNSSGPPAALTGEGIKLPFIFEAVRGIYRNIFGLASFEKVDRFQSEIQLAGHPTLSEHSGMAFKSRVTLPRDYSPDVYRPFHPETPLADEKALFEAAARLERAFCSKRVS